MPRKKIVTIKIATPIRNISVNPKQKGVYMGYILDANNNFHMFNDQGEYLTLDEIGKKPIKKK